MPRTKDEDFYISGEIQRIQYMPTGNNYRITFDIYEIDTHKIKNLIGKEQPPIKIILVDDSE